MTRCPDVVDVEISNFTKKKKRQLPFPDVTLQDGKSTVVVDAETETKKRVTGPDDQLQKPTKKARERESKNSNSEGARPVNRLVAPPTPWSSIMAWRTLMAMVMAALLATSSCLAQDALPDLPDVPEMPAIGTTVNSRLDRRRLLHGGVPTGGMPAIGTTSESLYSMGRRSLQQYPGINMPGPFLAGGWSDVSVDERFQDLVNVFNYASLVVPSLNANASTKGGTLQLCEAKSQVVAGMNYFMSLSPDCAGGDDRKNVTVYQSLDGQYEITEMSGF